jgi:hypothetical protein
MSADSNGKRDDTIRRGDAGRPIWATSPTWRPIRPTFLSMPTRLALRGPDADDPDEDRRKP